MHSAPLIEDGLALDFAQVTSAGGRVANQDALASASCDDLACFVMSDGVGGHDGGEVASKTVVEAVIGRFMEEAAFGPRALLSYLDFANAQVACRKAEEHGLSEMSATVAALLIDQRNRLALWAHMGDTRVYLFRSNMLHGVTKDHSLVQQMVDAGLCGPGQLRSHPHRSTLCLAVNGEGERSAEVIESPAAIQAGDRFLLCTDGFWEWIAEEEMEQAAASTCTAAQWLAAMRAVVETNGRHSAAPDNYSAFAICIGEPIPQQLCDPPR